MKALAGCLIVLMLLLLCQVAGVPASSAGTQVALSELPREQPRDGMSRAVAGLGNNSLGFLAALDDSTYEIDAAAHQAEASDFVRAVLGCTKCLVGMLAVIGLFALASLRRAVRRFLP
jgi:hypothetical protein